MAETVTAGPDIGAPPPSVESHDPDRAPSAALVLGCLGVVYGDIGTSPLYALRESLLHAHQHGMAETAVIGIVSMLFWTVVLIVTLLALAALGAIGARAGGAPVGRAVARVLLWGGFAMAVTAAIGHLFGTTVA